MKKTLPKNAKLIPPEAKPVFKGKIFDVYQWQQKLYDGSFETFEMLKRANTVNILAIKDDKLVILKQQQPRKSEFYSLPGGRLDNHNENELKAAKRELREETGLSFKNWKLILVKQPASKMEWFIYWYVATNFEKQEPQKLDAGEKIEVKMMTLPEVHNIIGELNDNSRADFPDEIFNNINSLDDLANFPEYKD